MIKKKQTTKFINAIRDIDTKKLNKYTLKDKFLIEFAIILNNKKILQALLDKGVDTRSKGKKIYLNLIEFVIKHDNISLIKILFDHDNKLINYKDNDESTPLHIAISYNDIKALKIILDYGANINSIDKNKNTPLHVACKVNKTPLIHLLFKYNPRINTKNIDGETPLMLSTMHNNVTICRELINRGANINAQDNFNNFPLYIAGYYNYFKLIKYYLTIKNININLQTNQGYTILMELISNIKKVKSSDYKNFLNIVYRLIYKYHIDVNIYNEYSETTLHILLLKDKKCKYFIELYEILIKNTIDLNVKDTYGNSALHLIIKNNCFTRLKPFLKYRKLDIFSKDIEGKTVFDSSKKSKSLLNFVINNYLTLLMKNNYKMKWQQTCSSYSSDKKKIIKYIKTDKSNNYEKKTNQELCKLLIKEKIVENKQSFPENPININILKKPLSNISNFGGYPFETLFGLIFLLKRHKKDCAPINFPYTKNKKLVQFLKKHNRYSINDWPPVDLFEIYFFKSRVFFPVKFEKNIKSCIRKKFRYIIIPLFIGFHKSSGHANFIIYDIKENIVERFEPHGILKFYEINTKQLDIQIKKKFKKINPTIQYYSPKCLFSTIGIQTIEGRDKRSKWKGDPGGFCAAWSLYYADLRLSNPKIPRKELLTYTIKKIKEKDTLRNFIRNYIQYIMRQRDKVLKKAGINIHNWINHNYTDVQFKQVKQETNILLKELVKKYTG